MIIVTLSEIVGLGLLVLTIVLIVYAHVSAARAQNRDQ